MSRAPHPDWPNGEPILRRFPAPRAPAVRAATLSLSRSNTMLKRQFSRLLETHRSRRRPSRDRRAVRLAGLELLEIRATPAVTAVFSPGAGLLTVLGDNLDNNLTVSRNAAGTILVNGGAVPILGGTPTVANTSLIQVFGHGGNDTHHPQRDQRRTAAGEPLRRRRQRHAHRRLRQRPALRPGRQRHAAGQGRRRPALRRRRQRHPDRRRPATTRSSARPATTG